MMPVMAVQPLVIRIPDPSLVVLVGAAGSGKSTFAARHFAPDEILSSDAFRALVAGDATDQRATRPAFAALHRALAQRLAAGRLSVVDATNVQSHARRTLLARARAAGVPVVAIVLDLSPEIVLARNAGRAGGAAVPDDAVRGHLSSLAATLTSDALQAWAGFDAVHHLRRPWPGAPPRRRSACRRPGGRSRAPRPPRVRGRAGRSRTRRRTRRPRRSRPRP
jgi:protein phosphatase